MIKRFRISTKNVGLSPGSLVFTGARQLERSHVSSIVYDASQVAEQTHDTPAEVGPRAPDAPGVQWVNVDGLHDLDVLHAIGERFGLHQLAVEDVAAVGGRPKIVEYGGLLFISLRMLTWTEESMVTAEHVSLVLGPNWVLSFQERPGDVFDRVRERIRGATTRIRTRGADYLWYALIDAIVDHYIPVMDRLAQHAEALEERVWRSESDGGDTGLVQRLRGEALEVRRALRPLREEVDTLVRQTPQVVTEPTRPFLADLRDHILQMSDLLDGIRDSLASVMDAHLAIVSLRTNEVMKVLTIMASIFIPLTFIVGVYGMNFAYMPELEMRWAYPAVWVAMTLLTAGMLVYFRRRKWM